MSVKADLKSAMRHPIDASGKLFVFTNCMTGGNLMNGRL